MKTSTHVERTVAGQTARVAKHPRWQRMLECGEKWIPYGPGVDFAASERRTRVEG
jgi:hypothetical protein